MGCDLIVISLVFWVFLSIFSPLSLFLIEEMLESKKLFIKIETQSDFKLKPLTQNLKNKQAGAELCQAQGKIKLANFGSFCLICLVGFGVFV